MSGSEEIKEATVVQLAKKLGEIIVAEEMQELLAENKQFMLDLLRAVAKGKNKKEKSKKRKQ